MSRFNPVVPRPSLMLLLVLVAGLASAGSASFVRVRVDTANLREGPGTGYERLALVYENDPLRVLGRRGRWLRTRDFQGIVGWIHAPLTDGRAAAVVTAETANVRQGPGTGHPVAFTAERGVPFRVLDRSRRWLRVEHADGDGGWVHQSLVWGGW